MSPQSVVSIVRTPQNPRQNEVADAVKKAIQAAGGLRSIVKPGSLVIVKPNLTAPPGILPGKTFLLTNPVIVRVIADLVSQSGARPVIAEASGYGIDTEAVIREAGYATLRDQGYEVIDLKKTKTIKVPIPRSEVLKDAEIYELAIQAQAIISVPVLKMHSMAQVSLSLKCMHGLHSDRYKVRMHRRGLIPGIAELCSVVRPAFAVIDGIYAMEGLGHTVEMDVVIAGRDPVAVDTVASEIMGLDPEKIISLKKAAQLGIGTMDRQQIRVVGDPIESVRRRLLLPEEDRPVEPEGFNIAQAEGACGICRNMVLSTLGFMRNTPLLECFRGLTFVTGDAGVPPGTPEESIVTIGNCVPQARWGKRFVKGCPPHPWDIAAEVSGGMEKVAEAMPMAAYWLSKEVKSVSDS